jgi:hypothetical protein
VKTKSGNLIDIDVFFAQSIDILLYIIDIVCFFLNSEFILCDGTELCLVDEYEENSATYTSTLTYPASESNFRVNSNFLTLIILFRNFLFKLPHLVKIVLIFTPSRIYERFERQAWSSCIGVMPRRRFLLS